MGPLDLFLLALPVICAFCFSLVYFFTNSRSLFDLVLGGRRCSLICVTLSIVLSTLSPTVFLFYPVLMQNFGVKWVWFLAGFWLAAIVSYVIFAPIYHKMKPLSIYRYITQRYKANGNYVTASIIRRVISVLAIAASMTYYVLVVHGTCALVGPYFPGPLWAFMVLLQLFISLQALSGGAAVAYALSVVAFAFTLIAITAPLTLLGLEGNITTRIDGVAAIALKDSFDLNTDPFETVNGLSAFVGSFVWFCFLFCCDQSYTQSFNSLKSTNTVRACHLLVLLLFTTLALAFGLLYLLLETYWSACDDKQPLYFHHLIMDILGALPGLKGCYLSAILGSTLVHLSHRLMNLATLIYDDFIAPCSVDHHYIRGSEDNATFLVLATVVMSIALGLASVFLTNYVEINFENTFMAVVFMSCLTGPVVALYLAGVLFPPSNAKGALAGFLFGVATVVGLCIWYSRAGQFYPTCLPPTETPQVKVDEVISTTRLIPTRPPRLKTTTTVYTTTTSTVATSTTSVTPTRPQSSTGDEIATTALPLAIDEVSKTPGNHSDSVQRILMTNDSEETELTKNDTFSYEFLVQEGPSAWTIKPLSPLYIAPLSMIVTFVVCIAVSVATGGINVYALDWNLLFIKSPMLLRPRRVVHRRIKAAKSERLLYFSPKESFRVANLPETNYRNPRVAGEGFSRESTL